MSDRIPIFIAHPNNDFMEHTLDPHSPNESDRTLCGIRWIDLPDIVAEDGSLWIGDKPWYADHDRANVITCAICQPPTDH